MNALDQAQAESGYVVDATNGWVLLAAALVIAVYLIHASWRRERRGRRR